MKFFKDTLQSATLLAVVTAFFGGSVNISAKFALEVFHPFTFITIRFFFATLFILPFVLKHDELKLRNIKKFFWIGVLGALNPMLLFIALQFTLASVSPLIYAGVPAMTAVYLYLVNKERLNTRQLVGIILGLIGVGIIVLLPLFEKHIALIALKGNILIVIAAITFMLYGIKSKHAQTNLQSSPIALVFYFCLITLLLSIPFSLFELVKYGVPKNIQFIHFINGMYIGIFGTGVSYLAYQYALKISSVVTVSLFTYLQPIFTILLAMIFLNEKITPTFIIGGLLAVVGARLALVSKEIV